MDTYAHLVMGAAVGGIVAKAVDRGLFEGHILTQPDNEFSTSQAAKLSALALVGILSGLTTHIIADGLPHGDYLVNHGLIIPNRLWPLRELFACIAAAIYIAAVTRDRYRLVALAAGFFGALPDLESLLIGTGLLSQADALLPTHNGTIPHGKNLGWISAVIELGAVALSIGLIAWSGQHIHQNVREHVPILVSEDNVEGLA